jgi:antitoxin component of RelBE/YafQ-DinJ toxin-antitoxin module
MARPKARRTKSTTVQVRIEDADKVILQGYADKQGILLSELIRMTLRNLITVVNNPDRQH